MEAFCGLATITMNIQMFSFFSSPYLHGDGGTAEPAQTHINLRLLEICLDLVKMPEKVIYLACVLTAKHC